MRAVAGLVVAFIAKSTVTTLFQQAIGRRMLAAAGWTAGSQPPNDYMVAAVLSALLAGVIAGVLASLVIRHARIGHALAYGVLFATLALWGNRATLFGDPHVYEWPLILAPLIAMPLGAWLIVQVKSRSQGDRGPQRT